MVKNKKKDTPDSKRRQNSLLRSLNGGAILNQKTVQHCARHASEWQPKVFIKTFGCQMNSRDSEEIAGMLIEKGYELAKAPDEADVIIFNTCAVRKHAEDRAISNIGALKAAKKKHPGSIIGICGCMAKARGEGLLAELPFVDFIVGPANIYDIPGIIGKLIEENAPHLYPLPSGERERSLVAIDRESRPEIRNIAYHTKGVCAFVTIMEGCNNFCSYCIVPYVRGREVSRPAKDILKEIKALAEGGYKEVTLLGQNVNSYLSAVSGQRSAVRKKLFLNAEHCPLSAESVNFIDLLESINGINGIERIRFLTSHPKDAGEDLFKAMRDLPKVCEHLHLPLQSGSDRILSAMNRRYTASEYLRKVEILRKYVPACAVTTDVIVGYPGESDEDFAATARIMRDIEFNFAFVFKYSPRPPAKSGVLKDDVPRHIKEDRNRILLELQNRISLKKEKSFIGEETEVLIDGVCRKEREKVMGKNRQNMKVALKGDGVSMGSLKNVRITSVFGHTLVGSLVVLAVLFCPVFFNEAAADSVEEYFVKGDYDNASREGIKALSVRSNGKDRLYYIVGTSLNKLGRYELAMENFKALIASFPSSDYASLAYLGIGDSYYLDFQYSKASAAYEEYIRKCHRLKDSAAAYLMLARCAQKEGRWQAAHDYYQKVRDEYPLSFEARTAEEALKNEVSYFTVQVGSFNKEANALKLCDELVKKGFGAFIVRARTETAEMYKVKVGKLNTRQEADDLAACLQEEGLPTKILP